MDALRVDWVDGAAGATAVSDAIERLLFDVLYRDFGVAWGGTWRIDDPGSRLAITRAGQDVPIGIVRLLPMNADGTCQIRQLAVAAQMQGCGVGRLLMSAVEEQATAWGATEVWLHARETAYAFYERRGYAYSSGVFVSELTGIPHRTMRKALRVLPQPISRS